tara:strand:+ start:386 stop:823 length:438 start_codon:yes stop_codon:yes gene_type:complete
MSNNDRLEIEKILNDYLKALGNEKSFFQSEITPDFIEVGPECETVNASQLMTPTPSDSEFTFKSGKVDFIQRIEISSDGKLAFFAFNATLIYKRRSSFFGAPFKSTNFSIFSGFLKKVDEQWKLAWIQKSEKGLEDDPALFDDEF